MDLLSLALSLTLPMSGPRFTGEYTFDVTPTFAMRAPVRHLGAGALALPGMVLVDPENAKARALNGHSPEALMRHELAHMEQQEALGPAFWPAYLATGGQAFEPYGGMSLFPASQASDVQDDTSRMWMPPDDMRNTYPLFRLAREGGATRLQFMPGYPELVRLGNE